MLFETAKAATTMPIDDNSPAAGGIPMLSRKCYENNTDGSGVLTSTWESVEGVRTTGVFVLIFDGLL